MTMCCLQEGILLSPRMLQDHLALTLQGALGQALSCCGLPYPGAAA